MNKILYRNINGEHKFYHDGKEIINPEALFISIGSHWYRSLLDNSEALKDNDIFDLPERLEFKEERIGGVTGGLKKALQLIDSVTPKK